MFLNEIKPKGSVLPLIIYVRYSSHERTENDLCVIFEEINLQEE